MAEEAVVLEQGTAVEPESAPGELGLEIEAAAETEAQVSTETESPDDAEEAPSEPVSPFVGKDFDEVEKDEVVSRLVKDRLAKQEESFRQKAAAERERALAEQRTQQYAQQRQAAQSANAQWAATELQKAVQKAMQGREEFDQNTTRGIAAQLAQASTIQATETVVRAVEEYLGAQHADFKVPQELVWEFQQAQAGQSWPGLVSASLKIQEAALREKITASVRAEVEKELAEEASKTQVVEAEKAAAAKAKAAPRPQSPPNSPARTRSADDILADPSASQAQKDKAFKAKWGMDPPR